MKVAIIGIGRWGQILLKELEKQAEVKYKCDSKTDLEPVFSDPDVKAVFVATPTETHYDISKRVLEAGRHLFLEKPGATNSADLEELVKLAKARKLTFAVGYEFYHHPAAKKLKELIGEKKIRSIFFDWQKWGAFRDRDDAVIHLLCHEISIAKFFGINPKPISCKKTHVISDSDIVETEFEDGIRSRINRVSPIKQKTVTIITEDSSYIWSNNDLFEIDKESQELKKVDLPEITPVAAEIADFLQAVEENREPIISGQFALKVFGTINAVQAVSS